MSSSKKLSHEDINLIALFLAHPEIHSLQDLHKPGILVICGNAIFHTFESVYAELLNEPNLIQTLVLCGGIGHSTPHLYEAVRQKPRYAGVFNYANDEVRPEAELMYTVLELSGTKNVLEAAGVRILVETNSTNCGANAIEAVRVLKEAGVSDEEMQCGITIVQDPTMSLRTRACFEKVFESLPLEQRPGLRSYPTFVPATRDSVDGLEWDTEKMGIDEVWPMDRFLELLAGEIPRLRDDENGYGPLGKNFITHVDVPPEVEKAHARLRSAVKTTR